MPRIYQTKGADRLAKNVTVPMSEQAAETLRRVAVAAGVAVTEKVRQYVREGLEREQQAAKK